MKGPDRREILAHQLLWRRLYPNWIEGDRPSSMAFIDRRSGRVSVHVAEWTCAAAVRGQLKEGQVPTVAEVAARVPLECGYSAEHVPTERDPSHAELDPPAAATPSRIKSLARKIALSATLRSLQD